jgi:hypothetical protein
MGSFRLVKELCKKCDTWTDGDENFWVRNGVVHCPYRGHGGYGIVRIDEPPPDCCPFLLEHTLAQKEVIQC